MLLLSILLLFFVAFQPTQPVTYSCSSTAPCGCSTQPAVVTKIVGGENALQNTWGWAVSLFLNGTSLCGGSILSSSWILTAAHCVYGLSPAQITIYAASNGSLGGNQMSLASSVIVHSNYDNQTFVNDIALINVSTPFNMSDPAIAKLCLPVPTNDDYPPINSTLVAIGWGPLSENGSVSMTLQQVTLQRISNSSSTCYPLIRNATVHFCAGVNNSDKDTCGSDSGDALMMYAPSQQWVLVGVTSFGFGCARAGYSGVYTRVVYYLNWISSMNVLDAVTVSEVTTTTSTTTTSTTTTSTATTTTTTTTDTTTTTTTATTSTTTTATTTTATTATTTTATTATTTTATTTTTTTATTSTTTTATTTTATTATTTTATTTTTTTATTSTTTTATTTTATTATTSTTTVSISVTTNRTNSTGGASSYHEPVCVLPIFLISCIVFLTYI